MRNHAVLIVVMLGSRITLGFGQSVSSESHSAIEPLAEVIITAEKLSEPAQKAPVSITVLDEQKLKEMGAQSFTDYAPTVPSLAFQSLAPGEQRILLRGVSDGVDTGLRFDTQNVTGVYIDDMVVSNNVTAPDLNLFDIARVEVLKGPQGTLYGDGSVGGLVRVITNKADASRESGAIQMSAASIEKGGGDYGVDGMINMPIVQDKLAVRLVGQYRNSGGFIDDVERGIKDVNTLDQKGFRGSMRWTPRPDFSLTLSALYQQTRIGGNNDYNIDIGDLLRATHFGEPKDTKFTLYNATAEWDVGWASLLSSTSYSRFDRADDSDFTDFLGTILAPLPSFSQQGQSANSWSQEFRLASNSERRLRWVGGLYFLKSDERSFEHDVSNGLFDLFSSIGMPLQGTPFDIGPDVIFSDQSQTHRRQFAAFGEVTYNLTNRLSATVGARWFHDKISDADAAAGIVSGSPAFDLAKSETEEGQVFRFRLAEQLTDDVLIYGIASQGYRIGGLNPLNPATINDPSFPPSFDPDKLWNFEAGWKTRWFDRRLTANGSLFYIKWDNIQIQVPLSNGFSIIGNAGAAKIRGVETDLSYLLLKGVEVGLTGSYIRAELDEDLLDKSDPTNPAVIGRSGDQLTGVPKTQGSVYAQWGFPLGTDVTGLLRADVQGVGRTTRFFGSNNESYGNYTLANLRSAVDWKGWTFSLFAKNITDKRAAFFRGQQSTSAPTGREDVYVAQPRTIGVTISKSF